jgi:cell division protein FtsB
MWRWRPRLIKVLLPIGLGLLLAYVADQLLTGERGLVTWRLLTTQVAELAAANQALQTEVATLTARVARLKTQGAGPTATPPDADYVDELIRQHLPLVAPGEVVIFVSPSGF